jgi:two-component system, NtrC family, response regulator HydG
MTRERLRTWIRASVNGSEAEIDRILQVPRARATVVGSRVRLIKNQRILVIDDHPQVLRMMAEALEDAGYKSRTISDSREAARLLEEETFDLLVCDIVMPHLHGLDILEIAKRRNPETRVLFVTAYANRAVVGDALSNGAFGFVEKPFVIDEFVAAVERALGSAPPPSG